MPCKKKWSLGERSKWKTVRCSQYSAKVQMNTPAAVRPIAGSRPRLVWVAVSQKIHATIGP